MILEKLTLIKGGTNSLVFRAVYHKKDVIVKQYGYEKSLNGLTPHVKKRTFLTLFNDYAETNSILKKLNIPTPEIITHVFIEDEYDYRSLILTQKQPEYANVRLIIIETYCGVSIKEIIKNGSEVYENILTKAKDLISKLPENIELDTNPANFTLFENKIFFVDFMPPKIEKYQKNTEFLKLFPQLKVKEPEREHRRFRRYNTNEGRLERFNYYLGLIKPNPQQSPAQTQRASY